MSANHWSAFVYIFAAFGLVVFMLVVPRLLGGRSSGAQKHEVFEAGVVSAGNARIRLSAKFYLVAIFFVIFDLEALYLFAYAVAVKETGWAGFIAMTTFVVDLLVGLIYAVKIGALDWSPTDKGLAGQGKKKGKRLTAAPKDFSLAAVTRFNGIEELHTDPTGKVPAQSSGQINVSNSIEVNRKHLANIDHINDTGRITTADFESK